MKYEDHLIDNSGKLSIIGFLIIAHRIALVLFNVSRETIRIALNSHMIVSRFWPSACNMYYFGTNLWVGEAHSVYD